MIVEANSVMMMGRQIGGAGGETAAGNSSAAMPFKKRKFQNRGSLEMSRAAHGGATGLAGVSRRPSFDSRRGSIEERRLSVDRRRNSLECLAAAAGLETAADCTPAETPAVRMLPGGPEDADDSSMFPISEGSDEVEEIQPEGDEDEVTATFHAGRLISKLFASGDKPSCIKVKGKQTDGFIVNKRFMDVMNRRNQKQAAELERLRQENLALRSAQAQPQPQAQYQFQFQQPQTFYQQQPSYGHVMGMPSAQPAVYPHQAMQSNLYAVPTYSPMQQAGPAWQFAPRQ